MPNELQMPDDEAKWTGTVLAINSPHTLPDTVAPVFIFEMSIPGQKNALISVEITDLVSLSIIQIITAAFISRTTINVGLKKNDNCHTAGWVRAAM